MNTGAEAKNPGPSTQEALPGSRGHSTCVVQGSKDPELIHGVEHVVLRGRVHEVELQQVLHPQGLEQQHHIGQVGPLDLGHRGGQELILVGALGVEPARRRRSATAPTSTLGTEPSSMPGRLRSSDAPQLPLYAHPEQPGQRQPQARECLLSSPPLPTFSLNCECPPIQNSVLPAYSSASVPYACFISGTKDPGTRIMAGFYFLHTFLYFPNFYSKYIISENWDQKNE